MDPNRDPSVSCANQIDDCVRAYNDYHSMITTKFKKEFMQSSKASVVYSRGLVLDIHGQTHQENWIELGYILSRDQLNSATLNPTTMKSSVDNLIAHSSYGIDEIIRGLLSNKNKGFLSVLLNVSHF